jgi:hypothetical protein
MKKLLVCTLMAFAMSAAVAAQAAKEPSAANPATSVKATQAKTDVVGVWVSSERTAVVAPGVMTLTARGEITLAPEGFDPLKGTYKVQGRFIDITTDKGRAALIYSIKKDTMYVEYENGAVQNFTKKKLDVTPSAPPAQQKGKK